MLISVENIIKNRIANVLAEGLLSDLGFSVLPFAELAFLLHFGKENADGPIIDLQTLVKTFGGEFKFDKKSNDLNTAKKMFHHSPDLIAVHPSGRTELIEVRYRANGQFIKGGKRVFALYPNSILLVISSGVTQEESASPADQQFLASLRSTRFHIWRYDAKVETTNGTITNPIPLSQWLIEEFKYDIVQVDRIVKEYEAYVTQWFSKAVK